MCSSLSLCLPLHPSVSLSLPLPQTFQDLQQVMVSGPNLNETSIVSGGYGGTAEGIIPTSSIKGSSLSVGSDKDTMK